MPSNQLTKGIWHLFHKSQMALLHKVGTGTKRIIEIRGASDKDAYAMAGAKAMMEALEGLTIRFPHEHGTEWNPETGKNFCRCVQFEDNDDCRHLVALRALAWAEGKYE